MPINLIVQTKDLREKGSSIKRIATRMAGMHDHLIQITKELDYDVKQNVSNDIAICLYLLQENYNLVGDNSKQIMDAAETYDKKEEELHKMFDQLEIVTLGTAVNESREIESKQSKQPKAAMETLDRNWTKSPRDEFDEQDKEMIEKDLSKEDIEKIIEQNISRYVNVKIGDIEVGNATLANGTTTGNLKDIAKGLGGEVTWDGTSRTATTIINGRITTYNLNSMQNGVGIASDGSNFTIKNGRIQIGIRTASEKAGAKVTWTPLSTGGGTVSVDYIRATVSKTTKVTKDNGRSGEIWTTDDVIVFKQYRTKSHVRYPAGNGYATAWVNTYQLNIGGIPKPVTEPIYNNDTPQPPIITTNSNVSLDEKQEQINNLMTQFVDSAKYELKKGFEENNGDNDTPYGKWYGMNEVPWCAMFVSYNAAKAGIVVKVSRKNLDNGKTEANTDSPFVPKEASVFYQKKYYELANRYQTRKSGYKPNEGDIIFFEKDGQNHVGIVASYDSVDKKVYTIEGNSGNAVKLRSYKETDAYIKGYGVNGSTNLGILPKKEEASDGSNATSR